MQLTLVPNNLILILNWLLSFSWGKISLEEILQAQCYAFHRSLTDFVYAKEGEITDPGDDALGKAFFACDWANSF